MIIKENEGLAEGLNDFSEDKICVYKMVCVWLWSLRSLCRRTMARPPVAVGATVRLESLDETLARPFLLYDSAAIIRSVSMTLHSSTLPLK